jgi:hypothetical protein
MPTSATRPRPNSVPRGGSPPESAGPMDPETAPGSGGVGDGEIEGARLGSAATPADADGLALGVALGVALGGLVWSGAAVVAGSGLGVGVGRGVGMGVGLGVGVAAGAGTGFPGGDTVPPDWNAHPSTPPSWGVWLAPHGL